MDAGLTGCAEDRASVAFGNSQLDYRIERSARRRTVSIVVEADGEVVLKAPAAADATRLKQVVSKKARWIAERVRQRRQSEPPATRLFCAGETFFVEGRGLRLLVAPVGMGAGDAVVRVENDKLNVTGAGDDMRAALVTWYRTFAAVKLPVRLAELCDRIGAPVPTMQVREQAKRWGSCDASGLLRINWRIVQAAPYLQDYVLAHEIAHLSHRDHGRQFWALLGSLMPDYESRRVELARIGGRFIW